jgi:hypothetical protein
MAPSQHHSDQVAGLLESRQSRRPGDRKARGLTTLPACRPSGLRLLWFTLLLLCCQQTQPAEEAPLSEYRVKAAWLLNFARYCDWPATAFADATSPYVVGVAGKDTFGEELEKVFEGRTVKGRKFLPRRVSTEPDIRACHLLFISPSERRRTAELLRKLHGLPVLTVGESPDFLDQGGIINLFLRDGSVRFDINLEPARIGRLKLDANLLSVAVSVRGRNE